MQNRKPDHPLSIAVPPAGPAARPLPLFGSRPAEDALQGYVPEHLPNEPDPDGVFLYRLADAVAGLENCGAKDIDENGNGFMLPARAGRRFVAIGVRQGRLAHLAGIRAWLRDLLPRFRRAAPFVFPDVRLFHEFAATMAPQMPPEAMRLFNAGGAPLPSDTVWLEWGHDRRRWAVLAWKSGAHIEARHFHYSPAHLSRIGYDVYDVYCHGCTIQPTPTPEDLPHAYVFRTDDPFGMVPATATEPGKIGIDHQPIVADASGRWHLAIPGLTVSPAMPSLYAAYLLVALRANAKRIETIAPGAVENRKRTGKGLIPVAERRVVRLPDGWNPSEGFSYATLGGTAPDDAAPADPTARRST